MQLLQIAYIIVISIRIAQSWPIPKEHLNNLSSKREPVADTSDVEDENRMELNAQDNILNWMPRDDEHPCSSTGPESSISDDKKCNKGLEGINQKNVKNQPEDELEYATQIQKRDTYERKLYTFYIGSMLINIIMLAILMTTCMKIMKLAVNKAPKEQAKIGKPCPTKCKKDCSVKLPPKDFDPPIKDCTCVTSEARTINFDAEEMNEGYEKCNEQTPFLKTLEGLTGKIPAGKGSCNKIGLEGDCIEHNHAPSSHIRPKEQYKREITSDKRPRIETEDSHYKVLARKRVVSWQGYQTDKTDSFDVNSSRESNPKNSGSSTYNGNNTVNHNQFVARIDMAGNIIMTEQLADVEEAMPIVKEDSFKSFPDNENN